MLNFNLGATCNHEPENWKVDAVPTKAGPGFLMTVRTITCSCGAVANLTDPRGVRAPSTTIGVDFLAMAPTPPSQPASPPPVPSQPEPLPPGPGTELSLELERLGLSSCQQCKSLAMLMNDWGSDGCRERMDEIVADVLPRARAWFDHATLKEKMEVWWKSDQRLASALAMGRAAKDWGLDEPLKAVIRSQVNAALARWDARQEPHQ